MTIANSGLLGFKAEEIRRPFVLNHKSLENFLREYFLHFPNLHQSSHEPSSEGLAGHLSARKRAALLHSILHEYTRLVDVERETEFLTSPLLKPNYFGTLAKIIHDQATVCPGYEFIDHVTKHNTAPVFMYLFAHRGSSTPWPRWFGATQRDEVLFTFAHPVGVHSRSAAASIVPSPWTNPNHRYLNSERLLTSEILAYWSNFVRFDSPNGDPLTVAPSAHKPWPEYTLFEQNFESTNLTNLNDAGRYMILKTNSTKVSRGYGLEICQFWNNYLPLLIKESGEFRARFYNSRFFFSFFKQLKIIKTGSTYHAEKPSESSDASVKASQSLKSRVDQSFSGDPLSSSSAASVTLFGFKFIISVFVSTAFVKSLF
jgi:hypothetical protein